MDYIGQNKIQNYINLRFYKNKNKLFHKRIDIILINNVLRSMQEVVFRFEGMVRQFLVDGKNNNKIKNKKIKANNNKIKTKKQN